MSQKIKVNRNCPKSHEFIIYVENGKAAAICGCGAILDDGDLQEIVNNSKRQVEKVFIARRERFYKKAQEAKAT